MKFGDEYSLDSYVSRMNEREFEEFLNSLQRYAGYNIAISQGANALTEPQARELHRFLFEHGAPVSNQGRNFENIKRDELDYICRAISNRSR